MNIIGYKIVEEYQPYSRKNSKEAIVGIHKSGHISLNEFVLKNWVKENKRVKLYLLSSGAGTAIGIEPIKSSEEGLALIENPKWRSKYLSAKGFMLRYSIPFVAKKIAPQYDSEKGMIIAPLDSNQNGPLKTVASQEEKSEKRITIRQLM